MSELTKARAGQPASHVLRSRVIAAIEEFIKSSERREWLQAFASNQLRLAIDDEYRVSIARGDAIERGLFSIPLGALDLDCWAIELGGGVKDAALDNVAQSVVRAFARPKWWVA
jgi:hypothetical protein